MMNMQDQVLNSRNQQNEDAVLAKKANQFLKLIQSKIALNSFDGARTIVLSVYAQTLLCQDVINYLKKQIQKAQSNYKKDGNRFYWEWYVIFLISILSAAYLIWRLGIYENISKAISTILRVAKQILGNIIYSCVSLISVSFTFLCKEINGLITKIFG